MNFTFHMLAILILVSCGMLLVLVLIFWQWADNQTSHFFPMSVTSPWVVDRPNARHRSFNNEWFHLLLGVGKIYECSRITLIDQATTIALQRLQLWAFLCLAGLGFIVLPILKYSSSTTGTAECLIIPVPVREISIN